MSSHLTFITTLLLAVAALSAQEPRPAAVPADAITSIVEAFQTHEVVALGEGPHGNEQGHAFRLALIRDARFTAIVRDIIVECGNARHQALLDQFVRGDPVDEQALREMLLDSSIETPACDRPIYADFYRAVRDRNGELPGDRQLRILFGAPPVHWAATRTRAQYLQQIRYRGGFRDAFTVDLFVRQVRSQGRRALIVYGDGHLQARHERPARSLLARLDAAGISTFAVSNAYRDLEHATRCHHVAGAVDRHDSRDSDRRHAIHVLLRSAAARRHVADSVGGSLRRDALPRSASSDDDVTSVTRAVQGHQLPQGA